jgi:phage recombination protein Bet
MSNEVVTTTAQKPSLLAKFATKYSVEPTKMLETLKATAFKGNVSNEQMIALLIVADQYKLNPFTKEIYAFPDKGGIVPVVGVDGWIRLINEHPQFDGIDFEQDDESCTCIIYRKDRSHPVRTTEYMDECKRGTQPWGSHPRRMLRHKALIQCARIAFGFAGIYDQDEAERIVEKDITARATVVKASTKAEAVKQMLKKPEPAPEPEVIDHDTGEIQTEATDDFVAAMEAAEQQ